ncbi:DsbA family oxidoreductase [Gordonia sp. (in: high G+C Gram-positive bacteria)]|uniref:DsbA family oxidoreductase n=1 Tax=Gordonia sp. (in: high G+C Gram-positive bacteria) TaxID=84139 RepID=UPI0016A2C576|nr:DsbA family oxidoreductase [Gordonia sp. (in: high G+C Gram-positive bacteria)]NLG46220.1 DsbA family oxidoreductase [Gordonia sp. (in: high G+C Gram-positive bacteria)]
MQVEIWTDVNCPFCYLGKKRFVDALEKFEHADQVDVVHRSFELDPTIPAGTTKSVFEHLASKRGWSVEQAEDGERQLAAAANEAGLEYVVAGRDVGNSFDMHRLLHWAHELGRQDDMLDALYLANFAESEPLFGSSERLVRIAVSAGFDASEAREVLDDPTRYADAVRADERQAQELGVNGVPFYVFDRKFAVSGAQPVELFSQVLDKAWSERPQPVVVAGGETCGPDGCEVPQN